MGTMLPPPWVLHLLSFPLRVLNPPVVVGAGRDRVRDLLRDRRKKEEEAEEEEEEPPPPIVFVGCGSGTLYGLDRLILLDEVCRDSGVLLRCAYDTLLSRLPPWRLAAEACGAFAGTAAQCDRMLGRGDWILIFPEGMRNMESTRRKRCDEAPLWDDQRFGFATMAIKRAAIIIPFALGGLDDSFVTLGALEATKVLRALGEKHRNLELPVPLPFLNRCRKQYLAFGTPLDCSEYRGDWEDLDNCLQVFHECRDEVRKLVKLVTSLKYSHAHENLLGAPFRAAWNFVMICVGVAVGFGLGDTFKKVKH